MDGFFKHSRKLLERTAKDKRLTVADRQILDVAMMNTRNPGDEVALSLAFLEMQTGLKRRSIIMSRKRLLSLGYLTATGKDASRTPYFIVEGGARECTPNESEGVHGNAPIGCTGMYQMGARECTPFTLLETGDMETVQYNEKPPRCTAPLRGEEGKQKTPLKPRKPKVTLTDAGFSVPDAIRQTWATAYPGVDIDREAAKAFAWCRNNPRKAPRKEYGRFLNGWLNRTNPVTASPNSSTPSSPPKSTGGLAQMRASRQEAERQMYGHVLDD